MFASLSRAAYPDKPITLIVPWAAGGSTDILARAIGEQLSKSVGQPVIVENRAGASGNIGSQLVVKAKPDGHTLLIGSMSTHAMNPALIPNMPFKGADDFTPIALIANVVNTMVVNPSVPARTLPEFIAYAKANPGMSVWYAAFGPAGMPRELVLRLNAEINKALAVPELRSRMEAMGVELINSTPEQLAETLRRDALRYTRVIQDLGIKLD